MNNPIGLYIRFWLQRIAPAFIFLSFGIWEIIQPAYWAGFVPHYVANIMPVNTVLMIHGIVLVCLGAAFLLLVRHIRIVAVLASLVLLSIILSLFMESGFSDILVRDITIFLFTAALIF